MRLYCDWDSLKQKISSGIVIYYYDYCCQYEILIIEDDTVWFTEIWLNTDNVDGLDETENALHLTDFIDNYKSIAIKL